MTLRSCLLCSAVELAPDTHLLVLNSAADPFVREASQHIKTGTITLAEDNVAEAARAASHRTRHVAFHDYLLQHPAGNIDIAIMNLLYQPGNSWAHYGLQGAAHALRTGGRLYVTGPKERGILSLAKRMEQLFGNVETLKISKGERVISSYKSAAQDQLSVAWQAEHGTPALFAASKLDEGTRLLLEAVEVQATDRVLDIGCGAGYIGIELARLANTGHVTMVDVSLAAVAASSEAVVRENLSNVRVLASDGIETVAVERFDLIVTNPPFHQGGIQTTGIAERFIQGAAQVLHPRGRFYLVANRFLKYESALRASFRHVEEVHGNARYKVLRAQLS